MNRRMDSKVRLKAISSGHLDSLKQTPPHVSVKTLPYVNTHTVAASQGAAEVKCSNA